MTNKANAALFDSSSSDEEQSEKHPVNSAQAFDMFNANKCTVCNTFYEDGILTCGHAIPIANEEANLVVDSKGKNKRPSRIRERQVCYSPSGHGQLT